MRLRLTLLWYKPRRLSNLNYFVITLTRYWSLPRGHLQPHSKSKAWQLSAQLQNGLFDPLRMLNYYPLSWRIPRKNWRTTKIPDDDLRWEWPFSFDCIHLLDSIHHVRENTKGELDIYYRNCCYLLVNHGSQWETARLQQIVSGKDSAWIPRSNKYFSVLLPEEPMSWFLHLFYRIN